MLEIWADAGDLWSNGLVVTAEDSQSRGPLIKTTGWLQVDSAFHPSEVDQMSTRASVVT